MKIIDILVQQNNSAVESYSTYDNSLDNGENGTGKVSDLNRKRGTFTGRNMEEEEGRTASSFSCSSAGISYNNRIEARLSDAIHTAEKMNCEVYSTGCSLLPVIDFNKRYLNNRPNAPSQNFEEGTSAFTNHIALSLQKSLQEMRQSVVQENKYAFNTVTATLFFNMGICKTRDNDYISAKSYFQQALELLQEVKMFKFDSVISTAKQEVLATHMLLTSITLLNLGHVEWHLSNPDNSIRSYHLCLKSLQHIESSELQSEALFYGQNVTAACLNCIGMVFFHQRVVPCQDKNDSQKLETQANLCLKYLEASLTIYEDCKSDDTIPEDYTIAFKANMATVLNNLGRVYYIINDFSQALYCQGACLRERSICLSPTHLDLGVAHFNVAQSLAALDENEKAMEHYHSFLAIARPILGYGDPIITKAVITISDLYIDIEDFLGAETLLREHLSSPTFVSITSLRESKVTLLNALSAVLGYQNKFKDALEALNQARDIILTLLPQDDDSTVRSYIINCCNIAMVLSKDKKIEKAVIMFHKAIAKIKSLETQQPFCNLLIEIHMNIANIYESIANLSICTYHLEQVVAISKQFHEPISPHVSTCLNQLGLMYYKEHKYETALSVFLECLHIRTACKESTKSQIIAVLYNVATVYKAMGMTEESLQIYIKVLGHERQSMKEEEGGSNPKDLIHTLRHIFQLCADKEQGVLQNGLKYLLEAVDICRHYRGKIDDSLGRSIFFLMGEYLTLNQRVHDGFAYYCEGCQLFGDVDDDTIYAAGENGLRIILAQLCTDERFFPIHAAAA